jgi:glutamyl-tRNA synthetase
MLALLRPRAKTLLEFPRQARFFIVDQVEFDPAAVAKSLKDPALREHLVRLADRLAGLSDFTHDRLDAATRGLAEELGLKPAAIMGAARVAITGQSISPGLFETMMVLGKNKTVARLREVKTLAIA